MKTLYRIFICLAAFALGHATAAQNLPAAVKVTYTKSSHGKLVENQDPVIVYSNLIRTVITSKAILAKTAEFPTEQSMVDRQTGNFIQVAQLSPGKSTMTVDSMEIGKQIFELSDETKKILGYKCKKARTVINSNKYDIWFTNDLKIKGSPIALGQNLGLILEIERNGNFAITASKVEFIKSIPDKVYPQTKGLKSVDMPTYRDRLWKCRFTTIPVFKNEVINFTDRPRSNDSVERFADGTVIARKIRFPKIKPGSRIFVDASTHSNGDAYDRTGSIFIIPDEGETTFIKGLRQTHKKLPEYSNGNGKIYHGIVRTADYSPPVELMRFFTPFGIRHYNTIQLKDKKWQDSVFYRQEISRLTPLLSDKEVWVGANIGNYDKGGHKLSVNLTIHNEENSPDVNDIAIPLFLTNNILEAEGQEYSTMFNVDRGLEVEFTLTEMVRNAQLRYITTGHGGWERGDEFLPKKNSICLNGQEVFSFVPWRSDCGSFRSYNPASGNFKNGLSSSDYSRSNWCPGTVTDPIFIALGDLPAGKHKIQVKIPQGAPEGSSFSSWNVSGVLLGDK